VASFLSDPRDDSNLLDSTTRALTDENTPSYAGFNLLLFEPMQPQPQPQSPLALNNKLLTYDVRLITNDGGGGRIRSRSLTDSECACGGISNGVDGQGGEDWPKVVQGRAGLQSVLDGLSPETEEESHLAGRLIELLTCVTSPSLPPGVLVPFAVWSSSPRRRRRRLLFLLCHSATPWYTIRVPAH
jgi:hypothetical protein